MNYIFEIEFGGSCGYNNNNPNRIGIMKFLETTGHSSYQMQKKCTNCSNVMEHVLCHPLLTTAAKHKKSRNKSSGPAAIKMT